NLLKSCFRGKASGQERQLIDWRGECTQLSPQPRCGNLRQTAQADFETVAYLNVNFRYSRHYCDRHPPVHRADFESADAII
ncbi:MAG: hypothetical protein Q8N74_00165, partial [Sulfuricella sp.]|nr:hypothetical protein [Sulfuricella sp.]